MSLPVAAVIAAATPAPVAAVTLRWSAQSDILTLDPHAPNHTPTTAVLQHVYEGLTRLDRDYRIEPALASGWTMNSPTEWRFQLRRGVRFHDGTPFGADDVVFSFERLKDSTSSLTHLTSGIREIRKIDDFTVDILLERPVPMLLRSLVDLRIMSRAWAVKNKVEKVQDLKSREETYASRNANGTGPFRVRTWVPEQRVVMTRNEQWWDTIPGNVDEVIYLPIRQDATRLAAVAAGEVDLVTDPPATEIPRLRETRGLAVLDGTEARTVFVGMDQGSDELKYSNVRGRNPFRDIRVRRALNLATDVEALRRQVMHGLSVPAAILVGPGVTGWQASIDRRWPVDLREARSLLTEAGYEDGFDVTLDCPNNRFVFDEEICRALVRMWARIGVRAQINAMPFANFIPKLEKLDSSLWLLGWGAPTLDAQSVLQALVRTRTQGADGSYNIGRINNPTIDALIDAAKTESDPAKRESLLRDALLLTQQNHHYLPLHHQVRPWVMRSNVTTVHRIDDRPDSRYAVVRPEPVPAAGAAEPAREPTR